MSKKNIKNYVYFGNHSVRLEKIKKKLPFLEKLANILPHNTKCDDRRIYVDYNDTYIVIENELVPGGEAGCEIVPFYLGCYKYKERGKGIVEIKENLKESNLLNIGWE